MSREQPGLSWRDGEVRRAGLSRPPSPSQIPDQQACPAPPASLLLLRPPASGYLPSPSLLLSPPPSYPLPPPLPQSLWLSFIHPFTKLVRSAKAPLGPGARLAGGEKNKTKPWRLPTNPGPCVGSSPHPQPTSSSTRAPALRPPPCFPFSLQTLAGLWG